MTSSTPTYDVTVLDNGVTLTTTQRPFRGYDMPLDVSTYGVPLAFTVLVVLILCMVIAYTKARRRRERQLRGPHNDLRSISGGVPMHVAAFRNYGLHLGTPVAGGAPSAGDPTDSYLSDLPPPYEVAIRTTPSNASIQTASSSTSLLPAPPAYSESVPSAPGRCLGSNSTVLNSPRQDQQMHQSLPHGDTVNDSNTPISSEETDTNRANIGVSVKKDSNPPEVDCNPRAPKPQASTSSGQQVEEQEAPISGVGSTEATPSGLGANPSSSRETPTLV